MFSWFFISFQFFFISIVYLTFSIHVGSYGSITTWVSRNIRSSFDERTIVTSPVVYLFTEMVLHDWLYDAYPLFLLWCNSLDFNFIVLSVGSNHETIERHCWNLIITCWTWWRSSIPNWFIFAIIGWSNPTNWFDPIWWTSM